MTCHRSHCSFRPHSPFSGRTLGSIRERSIKSILGSLQIHSYLWPIERVETPDSPCEIHYMEELILTEVGWISPFAIFSLFIFPFLL